MADVLERIVAHKRQEVAARLAGFDGSAACPSTRSLAEALGRSGARFIMEVKRASPSEGRLRGPFDSVAMARCYRGAADALSILVDEPFFGGSYRDLEAARALV